MSLEPRHQTMECESESDSGIAIAIAAAPAPMSTAAGQTATQTEETETPAAATTTNGPQPQPQPQPPPLAQPLATADANGSDASAPAAAASAAAAMIGAPAPAAAAEERATSVAVALAVGCAQTETETDATKTHASVSGTTATEAPAAAASPEPSIRDDAPSTADETLTIQPPAAAANPEQRSAPATEGKEEQEEEEKRPAAATFECGATRSVHSPPVAGSSTPPTGAAAVAAHEAGGEAAAAAEAAATEAPRSPTDTDALKNSAQPAVAVPTTDILLEAKSTSAPLSAPPATHADSVTELQVASVEAPAEAVAVGNTSTSDSAAVPFSAAVAEPPLTPPLALIQPASEDEKPDSAPADRQDMEGEPIGAAVAHRTAQAESAAQAELTTAVSEQAVIQYSGAAADATDAASELDAPVITVTKAMEDVEASTAVPAAAPAADAFSEFPSLGTPSPPPRSADAAMHSPPPRSDRGLAALLDTPRRSPLQPLAISFPSNADEEKEQQPDTVPVRVKIEAGMLPSQPVAAGAAPAAACSLQPVAAPSLALPTLSLPASLPPSAPLAGAVRMGMTNKRRRMITAPPAPTPPSAAAAPSSSAASPASAAETAGAVASVAPVAGVPVAAAPVTPSKRKAASSKKVAPGSSSRNDAGSGGKASRKSKHAKTSAKPLVDDGDGVNGINFAAFAHPASAMAAAFQPVEADMEVISQLDAPQPRSAEKKQSNKRKKPPVDDASASAQFAAAASAGAAASAAAAPPSSAGDASEASPCSICLCAMTSHGPHRACCLKCGHLFGTSCVRRWVGEQKKCPTCKNVARTSDIRQLFIANISVADTGPLQSAVERCQAVSNELVKQKGLNAALAEELKRTQARYENLAVSFERVRDKLHLMRMGPNKSGETHLTYIMSPTVGQAPGPPAGAGAAAVPSRPLSPSQFQYTPLMLNQPQLQMAAPHVVPMPQPAAAALPAAPSQVIDLTTTTAQTASAAAFMQPYATSAVPPASTAPILPPMAAHAPPPPSAALQHKPKQLSSGCNELQFPLLDVVSVESGRVIDWDEGSGNLLLSACPLQYPVSNGLCHGVMKTSVSDVRTRYYMALHEKPIRDMRFNANKQLLLSCSFDKTLVLSNVAHGSVVSRLQLPQQAWSCTWNSWDDSFVHVGLQSGDILTFDTRMNGTTPLFSLSMPSKQPLHSLVSIGAPNEPDSAVRGLIAATGAHVAFYGSTSSLKSWSLSELPLLRQTGGMNCASVAYDALSGSAVCAIRPSGVLQSASSGPGFPLPKPAAAPVCTVFRLHPSEEVAMASAAPAFSTAPSSAAAAAGAAVPPSKPHRWSSQLQVSSRVQFEAAPLLHPSNAAVSCSCVAQLMGHRVCTTLSRAAIFTNTYGEDQRASAAHRLMVACGDEDNNQCVIWDVGGERVLSRLNGQQSPITQVQHSSKLRMLATVSNQACCLYSTASPV